MFSCLICMLSGSYNGSQLDRALKIYMSTSWEGNIKGRVVATYMGIALEGDIKGKVAADLQELWQAVIGKGQPDQGSVARVLA